MISIVGIGTGGSKIAAKFSVIPNYDVYQLNYDSEKPESGKKYQLKKYETPEEYENNIPNLKKFFKGIKDRVQVFIVGSSFSSNYSLGILEQIREKEIDVFYIKPDTELLTGVPQLIENATFGILQEYARSGLFNSFTAISNLEIEKNLENISIKNYYDSLNSTIFSSVHYLNYFTHTEPEISQVAKTAEMNRIRSIGILDVKTLSEKWLFQLDNPREVCYYLCINEDRLESETGLHKRIVDMLKNKPRNAYRKNSYAIYETHLPDFGFVIAHTNMTQQQKTLDKLDQE